jgi:hypothetical protein
LLPYFTVRHLKVDPYDGASFRGDDLGELILTLEKAKLETQNQSAAWPLLAGEIPKYYEEGNFYNITLLEPRDQALAIFQRAIDLGKLALSRNEELIFTGD